MDDVQPSPAIFHPPSSIFVFVRFVPFVFFVV
jgi:hypothetical protein